MTGFPPLFSLVQEVLVFCRVKIIFCPGLTAQRNTIGNLLEVVQTTGDSAVSVYVRLMDARPLTPLYISERVRIGWRSASTMPGAVSELALMNQQPL